MESLAEESGRLLVVLVLVFELRDGLFDGGEVALGHVGFGLELGQGQVYISKGGGDVSVCGFGVGDLMTIDL